MSRQKDKVKKFVCDRGTYIKIEQIKGGYQANSYIVIRMEDKSQFFLKEYRINSFSKKQRAEQEIENLKKLPVQDFTPAFVDSFVGDEKVLLVMSFLENSDNFEKVFRKCESEEELSVEVRINLFSQLLKIINFLHQHNIYHRDLKPGNIMLDRDRNTIKVVDLGLSITDSQKNKGITKTDERLGALGFQCPESEHGDAVINLSRYDIYSLGKLLYYFLKADIKNSGTFPREEFQTAKYMLPREMTPFSNILAKIVTTKELQAQIITIEDLIGQFSIAAEAFLAIPNTSEPSNLSNLIMQDDNGLQQKSAQTTQIQKEDQLRLITRVMNSSIKDIFDSIVEKNSRPEQGPTLSVFQEGTTETNARFFGYPREWENNEQFHFWDLDLVQMTSVRYLEKPDFGVYFRVYVYRDPENPSIDSLSFRGFFCIVKGLDENQQIIQEFFPFGSTDLFFNNTSMINQAYVQRHISEWLTGLGASLEKYLFENYLVWRDAYKVLNG